MCPSSQHIGALSHCWLQGLGKTVQTIAFLSAVLRKTGVTRTDRDSAAERALPADTVYVPPMFAALPSSNRTSLQPQLAGCRCPWSVCIAALPELLGRTTVQARAVVVLSTAQ